MKYEFSYQILCISQTVFLFSFSFVLFRPLFQPILVSEELERECVRCA